MHLGIDASSLRGGRLICAMPDRGRTIEFDTAGGRVIVATALMPVAARCGADAVTRDFAEFVRAHVEARRQASRRDAGD